MNLLQRNAGNPSEDLSSVRTKALLLGAVVGAAFGVLSGYLYTRGCRGRCLPAGPRAAYFDR